MSATPEPGAAGPGSGRSCQDQCGHLKCQWRSSGEPRCAHLWHPPLGGESTGIHSPRLDCHCSTPPTSLNFTLRHVNADPCSFHASSSVVYWLDSELDFPCVPAYLRAYAAWDWDTQSQTPPLCKGPDRGGRVQEQPPLFLEFMQALTPHFYWIAEREHCGLWMVAKRVDLWLNRVFDTAEDFRLQGALPALLVALRKLHPDAWEACLHINTSPIPRFMGGVEDAILDRRLGPIGSHQLPDDLWDAVVPPFYRGGLQDFDVEGEWQDGDRVVRGATRWVSQQVQRIVQALRGAGSTRRRLTPPPPHVLPLRHPQILREGILDLELRQDQQE